MQRIKIDFDNPGLPKRLDVMENDAQSRFFEAELYQGGKAYSAPSGATYSIMYHGFGPQNEGWYDTINDGAGKRAACTVSGNVVTCELARQALQVPGHMTVILCVTASNGYMLKGWPITANVRNDDYNDGEEVEMYFNLSGNVSNAIEQLKKAMAEAEQAKKDIETKAAEALASIPEDYTELDSAVKQIKEEKVNKNGTDEVTAENCEFIRKSPQLFNKDDAVNETTWSQPNEKTQKTNSVAILMAMPNETYKMNVKQYASRRYLSLKLFANNILVADLSADKIETQYINHENGVLTLTIQSRYNSNNVTSAGISLYVNALDFDGYQGTFGKLKDNLIVTRADKWDGKYHAFGDDKIKDRYLPTDIPVPTKTSELVNDSGFLTASDISIPNNKRIMCRGDSLTAGAGAGESQYKYTSVLQNLIKSNTIVSYFAVGGESAEKIAARMGAIPIVLNPFTLPGDASRVEVTVKDWCDRNLVFYGNAGINPCYVNNIECTFEVDSGKRYIKRNFSGESKTFDRPVELITRDYREFRNCIAVIWIGTNNSKDSAEFIIEMQNLMVKNLQTDRFIIVGLTCQNDQYRSDVAEVNKKMAKEWGNRFLNIYDYILEYGLVDENLTPTQADSEAIAKGEMPPSLIYQDDGYNVHFNRYGYDIVGKQLYKKGVDLGYWE